MSAPAVGAGASPAAATPGRPATTRVTILTGKRMTDLVLPSAAPMETYVDDTVAVLAEMLDDAGPEVLAGFDFETQGAWAFARPGAPPLKAEQSLDEAGVVDGSLLTLVTVSRTERYRPLVEDVIDAVAVLDETPEFDRSSLNRFIGAAIPVVAMVFTAIAVRAWWDTGRGPWWPLAMMILGFLVLAGSFVASRYYDAAFFSEFLLVAAFPMVCMGVALIIPPPRDVDAVGAPQIAGAVGAMLFLTLLTRGGPGRRVEVATFTVVVALAGITAAIAFGYDHPRWIPAGAIFFGLFTVTNAAKLTVAVARIALPPVPVPGEIVEPEELGDPVAARDSDAEENQTWQAIMASVPESAIRLTERTRLARQLLIGFVLSGSLIVASGAIAIVVQGHFFVHTMIITVLVTLTCGFRSRLYAERWCAWALIAAASVIPLGVATRLCLWYPDNAWIILMVCMVVALVAVTIVAATTRVRRMSPVAKRIMELFDGAIIIAIIPMLLWVTSVYDTVRNIRF